jgi:hypothetical protein
MNTSIQGEKNMQIQSKNLGRLLPILLTAMVVMFSAVLAMAQTTTLNRPYAPAVLQGDKFYAFSNNVAPISQLFLYRYNSANSTWEQIPGKSIKWSRILLRRRNHFLPDR